MTSWSETTVPCFSPPILALLVRSHDSAGAIAALLLSVVYFHSILLRRNVAARTKEQLICLQASVAPVLLEYTLIVSIGSGIGIQLSIAI